MKIFVLPTFSGLIDSIRASANVSGGLHLFDIAYTLGVRSLPEGFNACLDFKGQFALASLLYFTLSNLFPSRETVLEHAINELETTHGDKGPADGLDSAGAAGQVKVASDVWRGRREYMYGLALPSGIIVISSARDRAHYVSLTTYTPGIWCQVGGGLYPLQMVLP